VGVRLRIETRECFADGSGSAIGCSTSERRPSRKWVPRLDKRAICASNLSAWFAFTALEPLRNLYVSPFSDPFHDTYPVSFRHIGLMNGRGLVEGRFEQHPDWRGDREDMVA